MFTRPLLLFALALCASRVLGPGAPVYWDSFAYVTQSVTRHVGGLLLGRPLFVLSSQLALSLAAHFGLSVWRSEPLLRALWAVVSALAAPLTASLASALGFAPRAALLAGLCVALSPAFAHTSDAVLTDAPAVTLLLASLVCLARPSAPRALLAGALLGAATAVREPTAAFALCHLALLGPLDRSRRVRYGLSCLAGFALGLGLPVLWALRVEPDYFASVRRWWVSMRTEHQQFPRTSRDLTAYLAWLVALGPAALVAAVATAARGALRRGLSPPARGVIVPSVLLLAALARYQDISFSPRYLLAALPCAVALPAALSLDAFARTRARAALVALALLAPFACAPWLRAREHPLVSSVRELPQRLRRVAPDSAVVTGQLCPAVVMVRAIALRDPRGWPDAPAWRQVCPGWGWPTDLARALDRMRADGRPVVLDLRESSWVGPRQKQARVEALRYARAHPGEVTVWP